MNLEFEDFVDARDLHEDIVKGFPENYEDVISKHLDKLNADNDIQLRHKKKLYLQHLSSFFLNDYLNNERLFSKEEMNYILDVRKSLIAFVENINNESDQEFLSKKGKLTDEQKEKYAEKKTTLPKVDKEKIEKNEPTKHGFGSGFVVGFLGGVVTAFILLLIFN